MLPPIKNIGDYIIVYREPESDELVIGLFNGDTYATSIEEFRLYMQLLKVPEDVDVASFVWNFLGAMLNLKEMKMEPLTYDQAVQHIKGLV